MELLIIPYWSQISLGKLVRIHGLISVKEVGLDGVSCIEDGFSGSVELVIISVKVETMKTDGITEGDYVG